MKTETSLKTLKCIHCGKAFKYNIERKRHEQSHFPRFECTVCCKKFSFLSALQRHQKQHERTGSVRCDECGRNFRDETLLKRHIKYVHKGSYICAKCSVTFNSELALQTHMKTHKPQSERRFHCSYSGCNKTFNFSHHLKHHELTHTNAKQHYCNKCGKGFIQLHHLKTHLKSHEPNENWLPCIVPDCTKRFANEYARRRHLSSHNTTLCATCGQLISGNQYVKHLMKCIQEQGNIPKEIIDTPEENQNNIVLITKPVESPIKKDKNTKILSDREVSSCTLALGGCIVTGTNEIDENCLCAKISSPVDEYDLTPNEKVDNPMTSYTNPKLADDNQNIDKDLNACGGCQCSGVIQNDSRITSNMCSNLKLRSTCNLIRTEAKPEIEYRVDGTVKIKETFDIDIPKVENKEIENDGKEIKSKFVPYNSCKAVLGNCIVSGDGSIGEGCLCAKMGIGEQVSAQEIEEITPWPDTVL